jgi:hypothetical protein
MMVVVLVLAVVLGLVVRRAQVQRDAVAAIRRTTGGNLHYSWEVIRVVPNWKVDSRRKPWCPRWLVDRLGPDYFGHVAALNLGDDATDIEMEAVGRLTQLRGFGAYKAKVTDAGMVHLRGLTDLESVYLGDGMHIKTGLTGASLAHLRGMTRLKELGLSHLSLADSDLAHLEDLADLESLDLSFTPVSDVGIAHLRSLRKLKYLNLNHTRVTDAGISELASLPALTRLDLRGTLVTDEALIPLAKIPSLDGLDLAGTAVTDSGLLRLVSSVKLQWLVVYRTPVTAAGFRRLRAVRGLQVVWNPNEVSPTPLRSGPTLPSPSKGP